MFHDVFIFQSFSRKQRLLIKRQFFIHNNGCLVTSPRIDRDIWAYWSHYCCAPWHRIHSTCLPLPLWTCYIRWVEAWADIETQRCDSGGRMPPHFPGWSWILLGNPWVSSTYFFCMTEMEFPWNFTTEETACTRCTWWSDERMKEPKHIPQQKIWCCTMLSWSCFVSCHGRWLLPFLARVLAQLQRTIHLLWIHGSYHWDYDYHLPANIHPENPGTIQPQKSMVAA